MGPNASKSAGVVKPLLVEIEKGLGGGQGVRI